MEDEKCCGTCIHHKPANHDGAIDWVCKNENALAYCWATDYRDICEDYEEREGK